MLRKFAEKSGKHRLLSVYPRQVLGEFEVQAMPFLPVNIFRKSAHCPASQTLLAYRRSRTTIGEKAFVEAHLGFCEFCSAELQLLECYRHGAEEVVTAQMPADLKKLAEELLPNRSMRTNGLSEVIESHRRSN